MNSAHPNPIAAVTAICPIRLNQPVNQPHAGLPSFDAQKYRPPAVGYVEAISPIAIATNVQKKPTISQPHVIATGPPWLNPIAYEVRHPARIEMIVKEIAKFWNPPIERNSSWA